MSLVPCEACEVPVPLELATLEPESGGHLCPRCVEVLAEASNEDGPWVCACGQVTSVSHWAEGADGLMYHIEKDDEYPPSVDYPEDHSPFCRSTCDHPCHEPYDEWKARQVRAALDRAAGQALAQCEVDRGD